MGDTRAAEYMRGRRVMEVNPQHPIIQALKGKVELESRCAGKKTIKTEVILLIQANDFRGRVAGVRVVASIVVRVLETRHPSIQAMYGKGGAREQMGGQGKQVWGWQCAVNWLWPWILQLPCLPPRPIHPPIHPRVGCTAGMHRASPISVFPTVTQHMWGCLTTLHSAGRPRTRGGAGWSGTNQDFP